MSRYSVEVVQESNLYSFENELKRLYAIGFRVVQFQIFVDDFDDTCYMAILEFRKEVPLDQDY